VTGTLAQLNVLLLGRFEQGGRLRYLAQTHALKAAQRRELVGRLIPMAFCGGNGHPWPCPLPAAWSIDLADRQPLRYTRVETTVVAEIEVDVATDGPFDRHRHRARRLRRRPDLDIADVLPQP
jgi:hypothetical protein